MCLAIIAMNYYKCMVGGCALSSGIYGFIESYKYNELIGIINNVCARAFDGFIFGLISPVAVPLLIVGRLLDVKNKFNAQK